MEDFQPVTRKKWLARRSLQRPRRNSDRSLDTHIEVNVEKFLGKLEFLCKRMSSSDYFIQAMSTIEKSFSELTKDYTLQRIICLGLGPFTRQFQALHQLAFIISTQRHFGIAEASYFDPVFSAAEKKILQSVNCNVMLDNCEGKYLADVATLFYLPHCPNSLTNNLLWCNWQSQKLHKICIINNSFDSLISSKPERLLLQDSSYILKIQPYVYEIPIDDDYEVNNIFNDLSVHIFPQNKLPPATKDNFWLHADAPVYENDIELITTSINKLEQLVIT